MPAQRDEVKLPNGYTCVMYDVGDYLTIESLHRAYKFMAQRKVTNNQIIEVMIWHNGEAKLVINLQKDIQVV